MQISCYVFIKLCVQLMFAVHFHIWPVPHLNLCYLTVTYMSKCHCSFNFFLLLNVSLYVSFSLQSLFSQWASQTLRINSTLITFHLIVPPSSTHAVPPQSLHHLRSILSALAYLCAIIPTTPPSSHSCKFTIPHPTLPFTYMPAHPKEQT